MPNPIPELQSAIAQARLAENLGRPIIELHHGARAGSWRPGSGVMICHGISTSAWPGMIDIEFKDADRGRARYTVPADLAGRYVVGASYAVALPR